MASTNFNLASNNTDCFYIQNTPDCELQILDHTTSNFPNIVFSDNTDPNVQKASKKIYKSDPVDRKKIVRKRKNKTKNLWSPSEDKKLLQLMKKHGQNWALISAAMEGRSGKQVRDRYLNKLNPDIKKCGDWSEAEDKLMIKLINEVGKRWSLIASHLPGRTEAQVKNRYYSSMKKKLESDPQTNQLNTISENFSNLPTSPHQEEDPKFDFRIECDTNMITLNCGDSIPIAQTTEYMLNSDPCPYQSMYTNEIGAQTHIAQADISFTEPNLFLSYNMPTPNNFQSDILEKVINHFDSIPPVVDSGMNLDFSGIFKSQNVNSDSKNSGISEDKMALLARRKAYLELALAKTIKEMKKF